MDYYVLQVAPREEEKTERHIKSLLPDNVYGECFHPTRLMRKKFHGRWVEVRERLLPGYVFITAEDAVSLFLYLKKIPLLTKLVGRDMEYFTRLSGREAQWLEIMGHEAGLSQIDIDEGNEISIISGPLAGMEGMVRKINLHKMLAEVEVPFMNGCTVIHLGIEMVEKKGNNRCRNTAERSINS